MAKAERSRAEGAGKTDDAGEREHAAAMARGESYQQFRKQARAAGEARVLAWWRATHGALPREDLVDEQGRLTNPLEVPAIRTGIVGALRLLDVHEPEQLERLQRAFYGRSRAPTLEQFALVARMLNGLEVALEAGDPRVWRAVAAGHDAMRVDPRYVAVELLKPIIAFNIEVAKLQADTRRKALPAPDPVAHFGRLEPDVDAKRALRDLRGMHSKLRNLTEAEVLEAVKDVASVEPRKGHGNRSVYYALASLAIANGLGPDDDVWQGAYVSKTTDKSIERACARYAATLSRAYTQAFKRPAKIVARRRQLLAR